MLIRFHIIELMKGFPRLYSKSHYKTVQKDAIKKEGFMKYFQNPQPIETPQSTPQSSPIKTVRFLINLFLKGGVHMSLCMVEFNMNAESVG